MRSTLLAEKNQVQLTHEDAAGTAAFLLSQRKAIRAVRGKRMERNA